MSYVTENLRPGEQLVLEARVTRIGVLFSLIWSWVLMFIPSLLLFLRLSHTELGITSKRVIVKTGLLSSSTKESTLDKVQNVTFRQSLLGKLFNYGTVVIQTAATYGGEGLRGVKDPTVVRDTLLEQMELHRVAQIREQAQAIASSIRT
ncbi:MAG: PH domain-containing protein [Acidobacteriota bacterium]